MKRIGSFEEFREISAGEKKKCGKLLTNLPVFPETMRNDIEKGRLFFAEHPGGAVFAADEGRYYRIMYIWDAAKETGRLFFDKPAVIDEINYLGKRDLYLQQLGGHLETAGFGLYRRNLQVVKELSGHAGDGGPLSDTDGGGSADTIRYRLCTPEEMEQAGALWKSSLDLFDIPADHFRLTEGSAVMGAFTENGEMAGCQWWQHGRRNSEGRHTAVREDCKRRGIASSLIGLWCESAAQNGAGSCYTWIADTNTPSLKLYEKMGFRHNGKVCLQYAARQHGG